MKCLFDLQPGDTAVIDKILNTDSMRRRFQDIGLIENTNVACVGSSPSGDPKAFLIRGAVIAIRSEDCRQIILKDGALWD